MGHNFFYTHALFKLIYQKVLSYNTCLRGEYESLVGRQEAMQNNLQMSKQPSFDTWLGVGQ
jgi:hypothetical protein